MLSITNRGGEVPFGFPREDERKEDMPPLPPERVVMVRGQLPPNRQGGTLVVTCELFEDSALALLDDKGTV